MVKYAFNLRIKHYIYIDTINPKSYNKCLSEDFIQKLNGRI